MRAAILMGLCWMLMGCGPKLIPGLAIDVSDTPDHRALLKAIETYRQAFQNKDVDGLVALSSPRFFEDSGTSDTKDDYNYEGLKTHFTEHFKNVKQAAMDLELKDVVIDGDKAHIDYHYVDRFLLMLPSGERWQIADDVNRLELVRENGEWKILSGM